MSYLAISRSVVSGYERNELHEKSPFPRAQDVELLKARIIEAVTVDPDQFDRSAYDHLWILWRAQDATEESGP